jgi:hypothetical protein
VLSMTGPTSLGQVWTISIFRWWSGNPASAWSEPNRGPLAILAFGMQHAPWQRLDSDLSPDYHIRARPIWKAA